MALKIEIKFIGVRYVAIDNSSRRAIATSVGVPRSLRKESKTAF
jgi:hypothetical protein